MKPVARQFACMVRLCWKMCVMMRTICSAAEALFWLRFFFKLFNYPVCANIKRSTTKDILPEWDISWVNTQGNWLLREFAFQRSFVIGSVYWTSCYRQWVVGNFR